MVSVWHSRCLIPKWIAILSFCECGTKMFLALHAVETTSWIYTTLFIGDALARYLMIVASCNS